MASAPTQLAEGVHRLGDDLVNFYLVEEGGRVTVVDAGIPSHRSQLESYLPTIGRTPVRDAVRPPLVLLPGGAQESPASRGTARRGPAGRRAGPCRSARAASRCW